MSTTEQTGPGKSSPQHAITPAYSHKLPNAPGKSLVAVTVDYAPGSVMHPHRHGSAFVATFVISGAIRNQVNDEEVKVYHAGESWSEDPGAYHKVSENASATEPARVLVTFVLESDYKELAIFDCSAREVFKSVLAPKKERINSIAMYIFRRSLQLQAS